MVSLNTEGQSDETERAQCDPTPEQIRERALQVRRKWSDRTRHRRRDKSHATWLVPLVNVADISAAANNN
jgi:hypothetical protein